jgi:mitochondrial fission protein ELM1
LQIWALRDDRVGSSKQAEALARKLGGTVTSRRVVYNALIHLPNLVKPYATGINFKKSDELRSPVEPPDLIVSAGRRPAGVAIFLRRYFLAKFNKKVKLITILNPNYNFKNFDLVVLPLHDRMRHRINRENVLYINGSLCSPEIPVTAEARNHWDRVLERAKPPFFSLMIGGDVKRHRMDPLKFGLMVRKVSSYVLDRGGTLLLSTSRRTSAACLEETRRWLSCDYFLYDWVEKDSLPNPYYLFLERSSMVFVTGDSISMISEIVTTGKPTYLYMPEELRGTKQESFCRALFNLGVAREIDQGEEDMEEFSCGQPLDELGKVSQFIKNNILDNAAAL